jgi:hypothetical protein
MFIVSYTDAYQYIRTLEFKSIYLIYTIMLAFLN